MVRKIVAIRDDLFHNLELNHIMEQYKLAMIEASKDK